ncbi:MAG: hypothetical protein ACK5XX_04700 [Holosporales bacterium]|jgi:hypothetical protein
MILQPLTELTVINVLERGVPNRESIAIRVEQHLNLASYGVFLGFSSLYHGMATPLKDQFFWFGESMVKSNDWIFIYTGHGTPTNTLTSDGLASIYTVYWNRNTTLFHNSNVVPILFRMDAVQVVPTAQALPQLPNTQ